MLVAPRLEVTYASVSGSLDQTPGEVDLTAAGSTDWAVWGQGTSRIGNVCTPDPSATLVPDVRKTGGSGISDLANFGQSSEAFVGCYTTDNPFSFKWTDGDPVASASNQYVGISHSTHETGQGYRFTVPADTTTRQVKLWVYAHGGTGTLKAHSRTTARPTTSIRMWWAASTIRGRSRSITAPARTARRSSSTGR